MTVPTSGSLAGTVRRVADDDEQLAARFPDLAVAVRTAVTTGQPFEGARDRLNLALAKNLRQHDGHQGAARAAHGPPRP